MEYGWCGRKPKTLYHYAKWPPNTPRPVQPGRVWFCNFAVSTTRNALGCHKEKTLDREDEILLG